MDHRHPLERSVALTGVFNFRDLGGYAAHDGRTVRWHTLFRADGLDRLTPDDVEVLRPYGLRTVVDLRMAHELEEKGRFPVDTYPVTFHHLSVMDKTWDREAAVREDLPAADFLHARYTEMLDEAGPRYADALRLLAAPRCPAGRVPLRRGQGPHGPAGDARARRRSASATTTSSPTTR